MKPEQIIYRTFLLVLILLIISCSSDESSDSIHSVFRNQEFSVPEDLGGLQSIGFLQAGSGNLTFTLESDIELLVNYWTGEIRTKENSILDYETQTTLNFRVTVRNDYGEQQTATITINVLDVEDGPLTNLQKDFVEEYLNMTYWLDAYVPSDLSSKWRNEVKLFIEGDYDANYPLRVEGHLESFNALITDGTTLTLVANLEESNIHLILGPKSSVRNIWPDIYERINGYAFSGYMLFDTDTDNYIYHGRIWVNNSDSSIFIHEMGHVLGLAHSSNEYCSEGVRSIMCSQATSSDFSNFDVEIIKALYHPGTSVGLPQDQMQTWIEEYVIENAILH